MSSKQKSFVDLLKGMCRLKKPLFWEVWFCMFDFCKERWGDYSVVENRIAMAKDLGMAAVLVGDINSNVHFRSDSETRQGDSRYVGGKLRNRKQLEEKPLPDWHGLAGELSQNIKLINDAGLAGWVILPWCFHAVATGMGLEEFAYACYDKLNFVHEAFEWVEQRNRKAIEEVVIKVKPDAVLFDGDCAYKTGLMVKPDLFRELTFSRTKETVSLLREAGIPYTLHSDGKLDDAIPMLIELGFSAVHGCEKAANDLSVLVDRFGDDICLIGNMDTGFLAKASPEEIKEETTKMLNIGVSKGNFIAACNTSPMDNIPPMNYMAFTDAIRQYNETVA